MSGGVIAVFSTSNELGTAALFLIAGLFLLCATFGVVPTRVKVAGGEVSVGRAALNTLEQIVSESDLPTQERVIDTLEENLARDGITRSESDSVEAMIGRFERYSGSQKPREVHDELLAAGWTPSTPKKSAYIRWVYSGSAGKVSLFQNSAQLVVASNSLVELVKHNKIAEHRLPKNEIVLPYSGSTTDALEAAATLRAHADGT